MRRTAATMMAQMAILAAVGLNASPAAAQAGSSPGCQNLNDPSLDDQYFGRQSAAPTQHFAGETITFTASTPVNGPTPTAVIFEQPIGTVIATSPFPGTVSYTYPADAITTISWYVNTNSSVTWTVTCTPAPAYPLAVSPPAPESLSDVAAPVPAAVAAGPSRRPFGGFLAPVLGAVLLQTALAVAARRRRLPTR